MNSISIGVHRCAKKICPQSAFRNIDPSARAGILRVKDELIGDFGVTDLDTRLGIGVDVVKDSVQFGVFCIGGFVDLHTIDLQEAVAQFDPQFF